MFENPDMEYEVTCPACKAKSTRLGSSLPHQREPQAGDPILCTHCAELLVVTPDKGVAIPTEEQKLRIETKQPGILEFIKKTQAEIAVYRAMKDNIDREIN